MKIKTFGVVAIAAVIIGMFGAAGPANASVSAGHYSNPSTGAQPNCIFKPDWTCP